MARKHRKNRHRDRDMARLPAGFGARDLADAEHEVSLSVRMPGALLARLEALRPALAADPKSVIWGRLTRSTLLRVALLRGIESLERRYSRDEDAERPAGL